MDIDKKIHVAVMMSSYNGEQYIREQIDSIFLQEGIEVTLYIRDDGSTDKTRNIINEYATNSNVIAIYGENLGFQRSFMYIVKDIPDTYDYYAFSDQDDYWESDKLLRGIQALKNNEGTDLYTSSLNVVDDKLRHQYYNNFPKLHATFGSAISRQRLAGCTMVFTSRLLNLAKKFPIDSYYMLFSHDAVVYYLALSIGSNVYFDGKSHILYRRHIGTVTEHGKGLRKRIQSVTNIFSSGKSVKYSQIATLYNYYRNDMSSEVLSYCDKVLVYRESILKTFDLLMDKRVRCGIMSVDVINAIAILLRCY